MFSLKSLSNNYRKLSISYYKIFANTKSIQTIDSNDNDLAESHVNSDVKCNQSLNRNQFKCLAINKRVDAKTKIIVNEYEILRRSDPTIVPTKLTPNHINKLLNCHKMRKTTRFWIDLSFKQRFHLLKLFRKLEDFNGSDQLEIPVMPYELEKFYSNHLKIASFFGQNLIIDLSFDEYMSTLECKNCAEQIYRIYKYNKFESKQLPFNLNLVNVNSNERTKYYLDFLYPELHNNDSYVNISTKSYLDLFPNRDLVYLSPHADQVMTEYDDSVNYIIGGLVDRQKIINLSDSKAKRENIRSMRLPLDDMMKSHNIQSLDDVIRVLHDLKFRHFNDVDFNWDKTLRKHLPKYKLKTEAQIFCENMKKHGLELDDFEDYDEDYDSDENIDLNCK